MSRSRSARITSPVRSRIRTARYAWIDFYAKDKKVGQMLFGDSITPGSYASMQGDEIHLYFPLKHFEAIALTLRRKKNLAL